MKKKAVVAGIALVTLLLAGVYFGGPSAVPSGQEPLIVLSSGNLSEFAAAFDAESDIPRVVLLLSPT